MAPPEPEWLLWAKRLRDENKALLQRVDSKPDSSTLETLAQEVRGLAEEVEHLQHDNRTLRQRMQELEEQQSVSEREREQERAREREKDKAMCEKVKGLGCNVAEMKKELSVVGEVVKMIKEDGVGCGGGLQSCQKYMRRRSSKSQRGRGAAKITYRTRTGEFIDFIFNLLKEDEALLLLPLPFLPFPRGNPRMAHGPLNLFYSNIHLASKPLSQATTTDDDGVTGLVPQAETHRSHHQYAITASHRQGPITTTTLNVSTEQQQQMHYAHPTPNADANPNPHPTTNTLTLPSIRHDSHARDRDRYAALESIGIDPQGDKTLEEYFRDGAGSVVRAMQLYEKRAAKAFVCGLRDKRRRMELWERLTERGWSWQRLRREMQGMVEREGERRGDWGRKVSMEL